MSMIIASAILSTVLVTGGQKPTQTWTSAPRDPIIFVDTRAYRHCHNRGRFTYCFKKDPRDRARPNDVPSGHAHRKPLRSQTRDHASC